MIKRMWINQPSTLQKFHKLHGTNVLATQEGIGAGIHRIYFLSGDIVSQQIHSAALSNGWV